MEVKDANPGAAIDDARRFSEVVMVKSDNPDGRIQFKNEAVSVI